VTIFRLIPHVLRCVPLILLVLASPAAAVAADVPTGLLCELLAMPERTTLSARRPSFGWIVPLTIAGDRQTAYQILVATDGNKLARDVGDAWDSGRVVAADSIDVRYAGPELKPSATYVWKVRTWNRGGRASSWSVPQTFHTAEQLSDDAPTPRYPIDTTPVAPAKIAKLGDGTFFADFGRDAFGYLTLTLDSPDARTIEVHLGEKLRADGRLDRKPGGSTRYARATVDLKPGRNRVRVETPPDKRNTSGDAIRVPESLGVILPFRYAEIANLPGDLAEENLRQVRVHYPFDEDASSFTSSDEHLNAIWDLCKYSIRATSAFGVYVDGDRERIPYEADAYINQLSHYAVDREFSLARFSHEYLLTHPTWPTEWKQHSVLIAHADWMQTGNLDSVRRNYDLLKTQKVLSKHARGDGLLDTHELRDVVDWPPGERDGFVLSPVNTVVNAFHYRTLVLVAEMAEAIGKADDAGAFRREAKRVFDAFNATLFDPARGIYVDGAGIEHASLHANLFALAFDLVPEQRKPKVINFIQSRGMACSVYPAQFLLEAMFGHDRADDAVNLLVSDSDRSWRNMLRVGSTITLEAWDAKYKPNLDWNHAWGAAPANLLPRCILGVRPIEPGFGKVLVRPRLGPLAFARGTVPTVRGPIRVDATPDRIELEIPANVTARVVLPWRAADPIEVESGRHVFDRILVPPAK
jgi:hypothetical protein